MKYEVITNMQGYCQIIRHTGTFRDYVELNLDDYDLSNYRLFAYKLGKNKLVFDENKYKELQEQHQRREDEKEISSLKSFLYETDYIVARCFEEVMALNNRLTFIIDFLAIMLKYSQKYKEVLTERVKARKRIEELEGK